MSKNKIAFLMPVYPPHYKYMKNFMKGFYKYSIDKQADLWFVFSNEEDKSHFPKIKNYVILPKHLQNLRRENGIINTKKFFGINAIKNNYEYIIVVDAEMEIFKNINLYSICKKFFQDKILWGTPIVYEERNKSYSAIKVACSVFFKDIEINEHDLCFWFYNLCVYDTKTLDDFFEKTNILRELNNLSFWSFDYYIYMFYLLYYQSFTPHNIYSNAFIEMKIPLLNSYYIENCMHMCTREMLVQLNKLYKCKNCFLHIHLDRVIKKENTLFKKIVTALNVFSFLRKDR